MSATPRTDAQVKLLSSGGDWDDYLHSDFARQLERELADCKDKHAKRIITWGTEVATALEAKAAAERELAEARAWSAKLADVADDLRSELAEAQNRAAFFESALHKQGDILTTRIQERDRLANALREMLDYAQDCRLCTVHKAQDALAAVKGEAP